MVLRRGKLVLGPGSKSTKSSIVVVCMFVCDPFSHKGANARSALTTLNDCMGSFTALGWRCISVEAVEGPLGQTCACSRHHWLACGKSGLLHFEIQSSQSSSFRC